MTAICKLCKREINTMLVGGTIEQKSVSLGQAMMEHMGKDHLKFMYNLNELTKMFSGFILMNRFTVSDIEVEDEKEVMRDMLAEKVMQDAPEDDIEDEDETDEDEGEEGDESVGEDKSGEYLIDPEDKIDINTIAVKKRRKPSIVESVTVDEKGEQVS